MLHDLLREQAFAQLIDHVETQLRFPTPSFTREYCESFRLDLTPKPSLYWTYIFGGPICRLDVGVSRNALVGKCFQRREHREYQRSEWSRERGAISEKRYNRIETMEEHVPHWMGVMRTYDQEDGWHTIWPDEWVTDSDEEEDMM